MQEYTVLPAIGMDAAAFWREAEELARREQADPMLAYLKLLIDRIEAAGQHLGPGDLRSLATRIRFFPGVEEWFDRIDAYVRDRSDGRVRVEHYIISAGLREILEGCSIRHRFRRIYASQYFFDQHGVARFPKVVINDTTKTQYLFRINKGRLDLHQEINEHMPEQERRIPFSQMLYIGDGLTDVPCMTVTRMNGGFAIAVRPPRNRRAHAVCKELLAGDRIDYHAIADYREGSALEARVRLILDLIIARIRHAKERFRSRQALSGKAQ
ncbi:MAG: haloacid dehalogenase-like hydrolase [Gammaproteobacteria bacterium]|nr:MAG: haloacid dehalogenase-like hydrolase [Gammaproteobacteria bacterium]